MNVSLPSLMIKRITALLFFFPLINSGQENKTFSFSGTITSMEQNEPAIGASVYAGNKLGTTTDTSGRFDVRGLKPGRYTIKFRCPGFFKKDTLLLITNSNIEQIRVYLKKKK